ncbi:SET and MYND domain-containing protein 4-like isoform X2 [Palaemon carinicauda]
MGRKDFLELVQDVANSIQRDPMKLLFAKNSVNGAKTFQELFTFIWNLEEAHQHLSVDLVLSTKCDKTANENRQIGNDHYKKRDLQTACWHYNLAIINAPHPFIKKPGMETMGAYGIACEGAGEGNYRSLAVGFSNRSAVLYEFKMYKECIQDIDLAFMHGFPKELSAKLIERKEKCLAFLKEKAAGSVKPYLKRASADDLPAHLLSTTTKDPSSKNRFEISKKIKLIEIPGRGKSFITTEYIKPGELIGIEEAYSLEVDHDKRHLYCYYCLMSCIYLLPCPGCTEVVFCSKECRTKSLASEHWLECKIQPTLVALDLARRFLAIKLLRVSTYSEFNDLLEILRREESEYNQQLATNAPISWKISSDFRAVYHLCTNKIHSSFEFLFMQCQISFLLIKLLMKTERYFVDEEGHPIEPTRSAVIKTGSVVLANAIKLHFNPYQVYDVKLKVPVASGMFPALSFINHSCYPNMRHYTLGRDLVMRAIRPIEAGQELTICYTEEFHKLSTLKRSKVLEKYHFTCFCEACSQDWPLHDNLPTLRFKCLACKTTLPGKLGLCTKCRNSGKYRTPEIAYQHRKEIDDSLRTLKDVAALQTYIYKEKKFPRSGYSFICTNIEDMTKHIQMPCQHMLLLQDMLFKCFEDGL